MNYQLNKISAPVLVVVDRLISEIDLRYATYDNFNNTVGFLNSFSYVAN